MTANHLLLGDRDWMGLAGVSVSASSAEAGMPAANVLDFRPGVPWRATSATAETLTVDFGEDVDVDTVAVVGHNGSLDATAALDLAADGDAAFASPVYAGSAVDLWPPLYDFGDGPYGYNFDGYASPDELGAYVPLSVIQLGAAYTGRYLRMTFNDPSSAIGKFQAGTLMAGQATAFERQYSHNFEIEQVDESDQRRTDGGGLIITARPIYPRFRVSFNSLSKSEALTTMQTLLRLRGRQRPVLFSLDPTASAATFYRQTIFGVISRASPIAFPRHDRARVSLTIDGLI